jgi:glycosyltransferase involved in cell wall biosynthesis
MLRILVSAYACSPEMGSEPGMAWNWCSNLAKYCTLYIITEGEFQDKINKTLSSLPQGKNMHFYYNPVPDEVRRMCWNQGDWRFYKYYRIWQWQTYEIAQNICQHTHIDILHQLNMIGFREPGYLWKIPNVPFVWGPIGGLKQFPTAYLKGCGLKIKLFNRIKNLINIAQIKYDKRVDEAFKKASLLISSIPDSYNVIKKYKGLESIIIPETGCFETQENITHNYQEKTLRILWVGKFDFRKQLLLALRIINACQNSNLHLDIYGTGNIKQIQEAKKLVQTLHIEEFITWHGNQPNNIIIEAMRNAHLFLFTSINEDTSTVVLEAISNQLPVVCFETCGMGYVIDKTIGIKIPLSNPQQSIRDFAKTINKLESNRNLLKEMSENCKKKRQELSWNSKTAKVIELYKAMLKY